MEEKKNTLERYMDTYIGKQEDVCCGLLMCYGETYQVGVKFIHGVYQMYMYYKKHILDMGITDDQLLEAHQWYTVKGSKFGAVSWDVDTYAQHHFQAVFVIRKFTLRVMHILNMLGDAWQYGNIRDVHVVGGYGSGPCMELFLAQIFFQVAANRLVTVKAFDVVDWTPVGGLPNASDKDCDLLITSFVLMNYVAMKDLPRFSQHLALEGKDSEMQGYSQLNIGEMKFTDKFKMWQSAPITITGIRRPRPVKYKGDEKFTHFFVEPTHKDKMVKKLLDRAIGHVVDIGAGSYDISHLTPMPVVKYDVVPRTRNTITRMITTTTGVFNMSLHHMSDSEIESTIRYINGQILVREVNLDTTSLHYADAVHKLYDKDDDNPLFITHQALRQWLEGKGWGLVWSYYSADVVLLDFRPRNTRSAIIPLYRVRADRSKGFSRTTIRRLRARHSAICTGPLRPFVNYEQWSLSMSRCDRCTLRIAAGEPP